MALLKRAIEICIAFHLGIFSLGIMETSNPLPHINNEFVNLSLQESFKSEMKSYIYRHRLRSESLKFRPAGICYTEVPSHLLLCNKTLIRIGAGVCMSLNQRRLVANIYETLRLINIVRTTLDYDTSVLYRL